MSLDTETTGLRWFDGDHIVSIVISSDTSDYYFNFKKYEDDSVEALDWDLFRLVMADVFLNKDMTWYMQNAKFDLHMLANENILLAGKIHDTKVVERLLDNTAGKLSLSVIASKYGLSKSTRVEEWLEENEAFTKVTVPGKKKEVKHYNWSKVPFRVLFDYALIDSRITFQIAKHQIKKLQDVHETQYKTDVPNKLSAVYENEQKLVKTVFHMEHIGVKIDREFCKKAFAHYNSLAEIALEKYRYTTGHDFIDSAKSFQEACPDLQPTVFSKKSGNLSYASEVLEEIDHPLAQTILEIRSAKKNLDFLYGFMYFLPKDDESGNPDLDILHGNFDQSGTTTGRFSSYEPNLQQLPKEKGEYAIRNAIVPRKNYVFIMMDFDQQEYRMMIDYTGDAALIEKITNGLDVHQAIADVAGIDRKTAKTVNFATLYGSGVANLAKKLKKDVKEAKAIQDKVFTACPNMYPLIQRIKHKAKFSEEIRNWLGRILKFEDPELSYRAPNALIQGGCADVVKIAMNRCDTYLRNRRSKLVLCIHDELVFEMPIEELHLVPKLKEIMETSYPQKFLKLTASTEKGISSLGDRQEFILERDINNPFQ